MTIWQPLFARVHRILRKAMIVRGLLSLYAQNARKSADRICSNWFLIEEARGAVSKYVSLCILPCRKMVVLMEMIDMYMANHSAKCLDKLDLSEGPNCEKDGQVATLSTGFSHKCDGLHEKRRGKCYRRRICATHWGRGLFYWATSHKRYLLYFLSRLYILPSMTKPVMVTIVD